MQTPNKNTGVLNTNNNNKRTLGKLYSVNKTKHTTTTPSQPSSLKAVVAPIKTNQKNEYNALMDCIKDILNNGESYQEIVNKTRTLVKEDDTSATSIYNKENIDA